MASRALVLAAVALAAGCRFDPEGRCASRADCPAGLDCLAGVCAACGADADCGAWQACGLDGLCAAVAGRCDLDADCAPWEACDAGHACALAPGHCADDAGCVSPLSCDPAHQCSWPSGACDVVAACAPWMASCAAGQCVPDATPGADVLALGVLVDGGCGLGAAARASAAGDPAAIHVGIGCLSAVDGRGFMDPLSGEVLYRHAETAGADTLRRSRRDVPVADAAAGRWRLPDDLAANDDVALDPAACRWAWDRWVVQAGAGRIAYGCPLPGIPQRAFYDEADPASALPGLEVVDEVLSWSAGGRFLARGGGAYRVVDAAGIATPVPDLPPGALLAARATATGFRVAIANAVSLADELWEVDEATGAAVPAATYAAVAGYTGVGWRVLDDAGALYGGGRVGVSDVLLRRDPASTAAIYTEPAVATDFTSAIFTPRLLLEGIVLVTRP